MGPEEQEIIRSITETMAALSAEKREFILGYAEGMIAMTNGTRQNGSQDRT